MRQKFEDYVDDGPLEIRTAFTGGRTGPAKLFQKACEGEKISYHDFTSLYPYIKNICATVFMSPPKNKKKTEE
ncbi:hypothetical protein GPALN_012338 [Globodera pallida]|nr:hypothetical protein GPALN_012338 [Globodera pallida]